jgi:hypothetical protein
MPDPWLWRAVLSDGTVIDEVDGDAPDGRGFGVVKRLAAERNAPITQLILIPTQPFLRPHVMTATRGATLDIWRVRRVTVNIESGEQVGRAEPITRLELHMPEDDADGAGRHRVAYTFLLYDGSIVVSDDEDAV